MITSELAKKQLAAARQAQEAKFAKKLRTLEEDRQKLKEVTLPMSLSLLCPGYEGHTA